MLYPTSSKILVIPATRRLGALAASPRSALIANEQCVMEPLVIFFTDFSVPIIDQFSEGRVAGLKHQCRAFAPVNQRSWEILITHTGDSRIKNRVYDKRRIRVPA